MLQKPNRNSWSLPKKSLKRAQKMRKGSMSLTICLNSFKMVSMKSWVRKEKRKNKLVRFYSIQVSSPNHSEELIWLYCKKSFHSLQKNIKLMVCLDLLLLVERMQPLSLNGEKKSWPPTLQNWSKTMLSMFSVSWLFYIWKTFWYKSEDRRLEILDPLPDSLKTDLESMFQEWMKISSIHSSCNISIRLWTCTRTVNIKLFSLRQKWSNSWISWKLKFRLGKIWANLVLNLSFC